jgi:RHS repeat-associated protein
MSGIASKAAGELKNKEKTYQGQRFDDDLGINWVQFKWRNHDPQIGRFIEIDPLSEDYEYNSTYAFSENMVVSHFELEGLEAADFRIERDLNDVQSGEIDQEGLSDRLEARAAFDKAAMAIAIIFLPGPEDLIIAGALVKSLRLFKGAEKVGATIKKIEKTTEEIKNLQKAEARAAKLSKTSREGKDFTKAGKEAVKDVNKAKNSGKMKCEGCGTEVKKAKKSVKGETPPSDEVHVDHIDPKSKGGSGTPDNGQVLCRDCNLKKGTN